MKIAVIISGLVGLEVAVTPALRYKCFMLSLSKIRKLFFGEFFNRMRIANIRLTCKIW